MMAKQKETGAILTSYFILYVRDQQKSADFYEAVLGYGPRMNVPGMTEFDLGLQSVLGLMPLAGVERLFNRTIRSESGQNLHTEVYLMVDDPHCYHDRAIAAGAHELSPYSVRDWGHSVAYCLDFDGNVLAFAKPT